MGIEMEFLLLDALEVDVFVLYRPFPNPSRQLLEANIDGLKPVGLVKPLVGQASPWFFPSVYPSQCEVLNYLQLVQSRFTRGVERDRRVLQDGSNQGGVQVSLGFGRKRMKPAQFTQLQSCFAHIFSHLRFEPSHGEPTTQQFASLLDWKPNSVKCESCWLSPSGTNDYHFSFVIYYFLPLLISFPPPKCSDCSSSDDLLSFARVRWELGVIVRKGRMVLLCRRGRRVRRVCNEQRR